jgi:hypothetical protein
MRMAHRIIPARPKLRCVESFVLPPEIRATSHFPYPRARIGGLIGDDDPQNWANFVNCALVAAMQDPWS